MYIGVNLIKIIWKIRKLFMFEDSKITFKGGIILNI